MSLGAAGRGWLKLMPAGAVPSPNYFGELRRLALDRRTDDGSAAELLRALIDRLCNDFDPDLLLLDARTGITATNTLDLSELADSVFAFLLELDEQLDGVRMVLRSLAPLTREADRPLELHGVISRVPTEDAHRQARWIETERDRERSARLRRAPRQGRRGYRLTFDGRASLDPVAMITAQRAL